MRRGRLLGICGLLWAISGGGLRLLSVLNQEEMGPVPIGLLIRCLRMGG